MMFLIKTFDTLGAVFPSFMFQPDEEEDAYDCFNSYALSGRFIRAELWSGNLEKNKWKDEELLRTKP